MSSLFDTALSLSEMGRKYGPTRKTLRCWIAEGKLTKDETGKVRVSDVLRLKANRSRGRKYKLLLGEHPDYYGIKGTPDWERAKEYFGEGGLARLRGVLACLAHHSVAERQDAAFSKSLSDSVDFAEDIRKRLKEDNAWYAETGRLLRKLIAEN